jgi:hypothetical protein
VNNETYASRFAQELQARFGHNYTFQVSPGRKFDKIVQSPVGSAYGGFVHAFVERETGALIKSAGWNKPQKNSDGTFAVRYNLASETDYQRAVDKSDPYGSYLYVR